MKKILSTLFILLSLHGICRAGEQIHFIHYNKDRSGLCYDGVRTLLQDGSGNIWAGTHNGLACFDGKQFSSFDRYDFGISTDYICALCEDNEGRLWIGTDEGIVVYNPQDQKFTTLSGKGPASRVYSIVRDASGSIWCGSRNDGLWKMDAESGQGQRITADYGGDAAIENVYRIASDRAGKLYFCSYCDNLYCLSASSGIRVLCNDFFRNDDIEGIACGPYGSDMLYVASKRNGLCAVNTENETVEVLLTLPSDQRPVNLMYKGRYLYLCTTGGLIRYDLVSAELVHAISSPNDPFSLSDNFVTDVIIDNKGGLWAATAYEGLNYSSPIINKFGRIYSTSDGAPLTGANVSGLAQSSDGTVWVGTENKGLLRLNPNTGTLEQVLAPGLPRTIMALCMDGDYLWLGYHDGLCRYDLKKSKVRNYTDIFASNHSGSTGASYDNRVVSLYRSNETVPHLYVGTTVGVAVFNPDSEEFEPVQQLLGVTVEDMKIDASGLLWLASYSQGLYVYDPAIGQVKKHYDATQDNSGIPEMMTYVCIDGNGSVWPVSFNGGFFRYDTETDSFSHFSKTSLCGISTDIMLSGAFDLKNRLWLASGDGLILYDPVIGGAVTFTYADGLLDSQFRKAALRLADGRILMGNKDGLIMFDPQAIDVSDRMMPPASINMNDDIALRLRKILSLVFAGLVLVIVMVVIVLDRAHRKALKRQSQKHKESEKAMEDDLYHEKMNFFANVIHEIKTPLTLIRTPLQNLMESSDLSIDKREDLTLISNSTDYLDKLVKELLEFISVQEHGYVLDARNIDVIERLGFMCSNYLESAKARNIDFTFKHEEESIICAVDAKMLLKIVNNLLHNALKYAETYICVEASLADGTVRISVRNDGRIIPEDEREAIFKPFVHFDANEAVSQSFGIGLSLARKLAQLHGGSLVLTDNKECNEFVVNLPYRMVEQDDEVLLTGQETADQARPSGQPMILIVEDNTELLHYLKRKLSPEYMVIGVTTAEKALEKIAKHRVDLLITDVGLPSMSGAELCAKVNSDPKTAHIPIIVLSAISGVKTKMKCMEGGASMYIEKPFSLDYLQTCIKSVLEKRKSIKNAYIVEDQTLSRLRLDLPDRDDDFVKRLDKLIADNISDPHFSNKQIEEALFVSRSSLNRKMKLLLGTTPNDYIRKKRLDLAAQMLSRGGVRVNEVCYAVGFNSPSYFAKCFREVYGTLPAEYARDSEVGKN